MTNINLNTSIIQLALFFFSKVNNSDCWCIEKSIAETLKSESMLFCVLKHEIIEIAK